MNRTVINVNLSPKQQKFLRFYYKCYKPFFEFSKNDTINDWLSDLLLPIPNEVNQNFGSNNFKVEVPLLYNQSIEQKYHLNRVSMALFQHRINNRMKDYYNRRFEQARAERWTVDFLVINIMNELDEINLDTIIKTQEIDLADTNIFNEIKDIVMKNNSTEFWRIARKYDRWRKAENVRVFREKKSKKNRKKTTYKCPVV